MNWIRKAVLAGGVAGLIILGAGYGLRGGKDPNRKTVYPVNGRVLYKGQALPNALVVFHPLKTDALTFPERPLGKVDAQGNFTVTTYTENDGAPAGQYAVTVVLPTVVPIRGGEYEPGPNPLPARYSKPATTDLRVEVREGKNDLSPIQIASK